MGNACLKQEFERNIHRMLPEIDVLDLSTLIKQEIMENPIQDTEEEVKIDTHESNLIHVLATRAGSRRKSTHVNAKQDILSALPVVNTRISEHRNMDHYSIPSRRSTMSRIRSLTSHTKSVLDEPFSSSSFGRKTTASQLTASHLSRHSHQLSRHSNARKVEKKSSGPIAKPHKTSSATQANTMYQKMMDDGPAEESQPSRKSSSLTGLRTTMAGVKSITFADEVTRESYSDESLSHSARIHPTSTTSSNFMMDPSNKIVSSDESSSEHQPSPRQTFPDQSTPDKAAPDKPAPSKLDPGQLSPEKLAPDHTFPNKCSSDHTTTNRSGPDQSSPDQTAPNHTPPQDTYSFNFYPDQTASDHTSLDQTPPDNTPQNSPPVAAPVSSQHSGLINLINKPKELLDSLSTSSHLGIEDNINSDMTISTKLT